jgi:UDP:flavonoid glycosyltransferase YjiC (YdhE family)
MARISIAAFGTRGDVQPVLALAKGLKQAKHNVKLIAGDNFGEWIRSHGVDFAPIGTDIQAMMQSKDGVAWVEGSQYTQQIYMKRLFERTAHSSAQHIWEHSADADLLMGSFTSDGMCMAAAEKRRIPYLTLALQPLRPTFEGTSTYMAIRANGRSFLNWLMGRFGEFVLFNTFKPMLNGLRKELGLHPHSFNTYAQAQHQLVALHGYSPLVAPKPNDWLPHWHVTGYWFLPEEPEQVATISNDLQAFIQSGSPPVYIGFGSATDRNAQATAQLIMRAVQIAGQRVVVMRGWAGLHAEDMPNGMFLIDGAPHSWLFPQMAGVVHHGGAGTTGAAFMAGVAQFVIPHFAEQPYWGRRTYELGVGVKPVPKQKLSDEALAQGISRMINNRNLQTSAKILGKKIEAERGIDNAVEKINQFLRNKNVEN